MIVAKLSTDRIVQLLKPAQPVLFAGGDWVMVCDALTERRNKVIPYWVPACWVVWKIQFC